jgi:hypothetical protein
VEHRRVRVGARGVHVPFEGIEIQGVVRVQEQHELAGRREETGVARGREPGVRFPDVPDAVPIPGGDGRGRVR